VIQELATGDALCKYRIRKRITPDENIGVRAHNYIRQATEHMPAGLLTCRSFQICLVRVE
jgi:hypothetical protein